ncbi:hypothetical protein GCM10009839_31600 [Catenulispora yoronensis]|uniref:Uncharacterized protein n=1 Tax=Catenulispora yoronensis TaxID=450799 RepID=A0ABN2U6D1_9ACTN
MIGIRVATGHDASAVYVGGPEYFTGLAVTDTFGVLHTTRPPAPPYQPMRYAVTDAVDT